MSATTSRSRPEIHLVGMEQPEGKPNVEIEEGDPRPTVSLGVGEDGSVEVEVSGGKPKKAARAAAANSFERNLAEDMDDMALAGLASTLLDGIEADLESRREWEETANLAARYLGIKLDDPTTTTSVDGTVCKSVSTAMLEALIKLWGVGRGELLPVGGPIKVRRDDVPPPLQDNAAAGAEPPPEGIGHNGGPPIEGGIAASPAAAPDAAPAATSDDLAAALETDLNHFLTVTDKEYYPDFSKMILNRGLMGLAFRKVYRCPLRRRPASVWVKAQDLIVSNDCSHLSGAGRITERIRTRQSTMRRLMVIGHYRDIPLVHPTGRVSETELSVAETEGIAAVPQRPDDYEHEVYECYTEIGSGTNSSLIGDLAELEKDENGKEVGFPLPYRVSIDVDSREVLEIRRWWKEGDEDYRPRRRYVKYGFIPGLGFYDWGLIHLVGNPTQAATMVGRAMVDATLFANFPGGVILQGPTSQQTNTVLRPNPGEFIPLRGNGGAKISDIMAPMPYKDPSEVGLALVSALEASISRVAGILAIPIGEGVANIPVGTMISYIEAVSQVPGAVHKDDHIAQQEEYELLRDLFAEDPQALWRGVKKPARKWQIAQEIMDPDLVPAADPNTPSSVHRFMKTTGLVQAGGLPQFQGIANQRAIWALVSRQLAGGDPSEFTMPAPDPAAAPPPPPDPRVVAAGINAQSQQATDQNKLQVAGLTRDAKLAEIAAEGDQKDQDRQADLAKAAIAAHAQHTATAATAANAAAGRVHDTINASLDRAAQPTPPFAAPFATPEPGGAP